MIFAAGIGSRLKPLTLHKPKALVEVGGKPLLEWVITKIINAGISEIIINVHHFADQIIDYLEAKKNFGINIAISDERNLLLDTGGGLKKASWFLQGDQPFLLYNVDILTTLNIAEIIKFHHNYDPLATLAVKKRPGSRYLLVNDSKELCGWQNIKTGEKIIAKPAANLNQIAFSGIHVVSPNIFEIIEETGVFSITPLYLRLAADHSLIGFYHQNDYWNDLGKPENLLLAEEAIKDIGAKNFI